MCTYVIAIGGNALEEQKEALEPVLYNISKCIAKMIKGGDRVVLVHGNGPQIGNIVIQNQCARHIIPESRIDECGAMTQALIGYRLQQSLGNQLEKAGINTGIITVLTQVIVDREEALNSRPTKPIGPFFSREVSEAVKSEQTITMIKDSVRGYRRVVPSPKPLAIKEINIIKELVCRGNIVIAGGGGGIPVYYDRDHILRGADAVIDKDYTAEKLAEEIGADTLIILTGAEYVALNYGREDQINLTEAGTGQLGKYISDNQFPEGSMLPKIQACMKFVKSREGRRAVIGTLPKLEQILHNQSGTVILA